MIDLNDDAEMARLIQALADDLGSASIHWQMYSDLQAAVQAYDQVADQATTFWSLTLQAHHFSAVSYLCRAYETDRRGLHLGNWLAAIQRHPELFSEERLEQRVASLVGDGATALADAAVTAFDPEVLAEDIRRCSSRGNPLVQKLLYYRNNLVAHRNSEMAQSGGVVAEDQLLTEDEFEALVDQGTTILCRYSSLFDADFQPPDVMAPDDFQYIFKTLQATAKQGAASGVLGALGQGSRDTQASQGPGRGAGPDAGPRL